MATVTRSNNEAELMDSIEFGGPDDGGRIKIYHSFNDPEGFKHKIDTAFKIRTYAIERHHLLEIKSTTDDLLAALKDIENRLNSVGDDAQLANVDLQNSLQKQQQTLQTMSNISMKLHDTAMDVIRKIGG